MNMAKSDGITSSKVRIDLFRILTVLASIFTVVALIWIVGSIAIQAIPAIQKFGLSFFSTSFWQPNDDDPTMGKFGVLPFVIGTAVSSLLALCIALPLGVGIAIFLSENFLPTAVRQPIRFVVELLAAIPSVVYGLWGIDVLIPLIKQFYTWLSATFPSLTQLPVFKGPTIGYSLLAITLVLALMVLPTITAISRSALVSVPKPLREGSYAIGGTRWETIFQILLPTAAPGIVAATILGFGRAMGETMAIAMLSGNSIRLSLSLFDPSGTLAGNLANKFSEASGLQVNALMYTALALVLITLMVNVIGELVLRHTQKATAGIR
jgi:phosphate transport system permease protein